MCKVIPLPAKFLNSGVIALEPPHHPPNPPIILPVVPKNLVFNCLSAQSPALPKAHSPNLEPPYPAPNLIAPPKTPYVPNSPNIGAINKP
jgi:hypothetical protein